MQISRGIVSLWFRWIEILFLSFLNEPKRAILWRYLNFGYIIKHISRKGATKNWEHFASNLQVSPFCIVYGTCKYTNWTLANKLTWRQCQARGFFYKLDLKEEKSQKLFLFSYNLQKLRGRSQTTLTRFLLFLTTYPLRWHFLWYDRWQKVGILRPLTYLVLKT